MAEQAAIGFGNRLGQIKSPAHFLKFIGSTHNFTSFIRFTLKLTNRKNQKNKNGI
jgi:hypothetical protein